MQRLSFERALDESPGKSLTHPHWLRVVEVPSAATARMFFHEGENPFALIGIRSSILRQGETTSVEQPAKNNQGAHLELASKSLKLLG